MREHELFLAEDYPEYKFTGLCFDELPIV